jgi:hypothetical protein
MLLVSLVIHIAALQVCVYLSTCLSPCIFWPLCLPPLSLSPCFYACLKNLYLSLSPCVISYYTVTLSLSLYISSSSSSYESLSASDSMSGYLYCVYSLQTNYLFTILPVSVSLLVTLHVCLPIDTFLLLSASISVSPCLYNPVSVSHFLSICL